LPSKDRQKAVATGTDNKPVEGVQNGSEKRTPFLTPAAYSGCDRSATIGNGQDTFQENDENGNCITSGELGNKRNDLSPDVTGEKEIRLRGLEPLTFGSVDRR